MSFEAACGCGDRPPKGYACPVRIALRQSTHQAGGNSCSPSGSAARGGGRAGAPPAPHPPVGGGNGGGPGPQQGPGGPVGRGGGTASHPSKKRRRRQKRISDAIPWRGQGWFGDVEFHMPVHVCWDGGLRGFQKKTVEEENGPPVTHTTPNPHQQIACHFHFYFHSSCSLSSKNKNNRKRTNLCF